MGDRSEKIVLFIKGDRYAAHQKAPALGRHFGDAVVETLDDATEALQRLQEASGFVVAVVGDYNAMSGDGDGLFSAFSQSHHLPERVQYLLNAVRERAPEGLTAKFYALCLEGDTLPSSLQLGIDGFLGFHGKDKPLRECDL